MNKKHNIFEKIGNFVTGKGFYLVVLVCIAAIGISGYYLMRTLGGLSEDLASAAVQPTQMAIATPSPVPTPAAPTPVPTATPRPDKVAVTTPPAATPAPAPTPAPTKKPSPAARVFTWPVNGQVIAAFTVETLAYDETMLDWRTHDGIDIAAETGTRVLAAAAGVVAEVYEDDLMGFTMVIDHGDGLTSMYANLGENTVVEKGESVYTGDVIGAVGDTAAAESGRESHLHFAMYQDGSPINPEDKLPK